MDPLIKANELQSWQEGRGSNVMVCSLALGSGINMPGVTRIHHAGTGHSGTRRSDDRGNIR